MREKFGQVFSSQKPEKDQAMNIEKNRKLIKEVLLYYMHYNNDVTFLGGDRWVWIPFQGDECHAQHIKILEQWRSRHWQLSMSVYTLRSCWFPLPYLGNAVDNVILWWTLCVYIYIYETDHRWSYKGAKNKIYVTNPDYFMVNILSNAQNNLPCTHLGKSKSSNIEVLALFSS